MKERPILFSGPMVRAILEGRKTQTRRVIREQKSLPHLFEATKATPRFVRLVDEHKGFCAEFVRGDCIDSVNKELTVWYRSPYGAPGDRLWVRETHGIFGVDGSYVSVGYKARLPEGKSLSDTDGGLDVIPLYDREQVYWAEKNVDTERWRPSIFMPRWASRITLEITKVRVERLQDISEEDAKAEGVAPAIAGVSPSGLARTYRTGFVGGWNGLNTKRGFGWDVNPWVWVIEFKKL